MVTPASLQPHLDFLYRDRPRKFALAAQTLTEYSAWRQAFRGELARLLGLELIVPAGIGCEIRQRIDRGTCFEEKHIFDAGEGVQVPLYLLIPKGEPPFRPVLVFHGHDPHGALDCLGHSPDEQAARANRAIDNDYALALAEAGYLVGVLEQRGMGERLTEQVSASGRSCRQLAFAYLLHGRSLMGERLRDGMCAATILLARPDVTGGLGCTGHSGGGATALWLAALDERIAVTVVSGYFSSFRASILAMEHCECNYVPGILELGEMGDLAALLAPRPFCAINGRKDELFPAGAAAEQFKIIRRAYALYNEKEACRLSIHPGGHAYNNALSCAWFDRWMG